LRSRVPSVPAPFCIYIGVFLEGRVTVEEYHFSGDRQQIREKTVEEALKFAKKCIMASR